MGLATIDPHSHNKQTKLYKITKFGVNRPKLSKIQPFENVKIYKEMYGHPDAVRHIVRISYISLLILPLLIAVSQSKLAKLTPNLGIL